MHKIGLIVLVFFILGLVATCITFIILYLSSINQNHISNTKTTTTMQENENDKNIIICTPSPPQNTTNESESHSKFTHEEGTITIPVTGLYLCIRSSSESNPLIQSYITNLLKICDFIEKIWILYPVHDMTSVKQVCDEASQISSLYMNHEHWQNLNITQLKSFFPQCIKHNPNHIWLLCNANYWFDPFVLQKLVQGSYLSETLHTFQFYHYHHHLHWLDQQWHQPSDTQACFAHDHMKTHVIKAWSKAGWYLDEFDFQNVEDDAQWMLYRQQLRNGHEYGEWNYQGTCPYFFYETPFWFEPMDLKEWQKECDDPDRHIRLAIKSPSNVKLVPLRSRPMARRKSIQVPETLILIATELNDADDQLEQNTVRQTWASRSNQIPNVHLIFYHGFPLSGAQKIPQIEKLMEPLWMEEENHLFLPVAETWNNKQGINENKNEIQKLQMVLKWSLNQFPHAEYILCTHLDQYIVVPLWLQMIQRLPSANEHVIAGQVNLKQPNFMMLTEDKPTMMATYTISRHLAEWFMNVDATESQTNIFDLIYQVPCSWVHVPQFKIENKFPSPLPLKYAYDCSSTSNQENQKQNQNQEDQKDVRMMKLLLVHQQMKQAGYCR